MTKIEIINKLTEAGAFELTQEILDTIKSDDNAAHALGNQNLSTLINRVHQMSNWTQFSWKEMIDLATQAYGFEKYAAYSDLDICADVEDQLDELHGILWANTSIAVEE